MISGTSMGALIGACYAKERKVSVLEEIALDTDWRKLAHLADLNLILLSKGFVQGQKVKSLLKSLIGDIKFKDLEIPFAAVATDAQSMEEIVISKGSVIEAVRASISLPVIFTPVKQGGRFLIDGGIVNPMPVDVVRNMGAEVVIAVNTIGIAQQRRDRKPVEKKAQSKPSTHPKNTYLSLIEEKITNLLRENKDKIKVFEELSDIARIKIHDARRMIDPETPNIFHVLMQSIHAMEYANLRLAAKSADILINPDVSHIGTFAFYNAEEAIAQGYKAAKDVLPKLQEMGCSTFASPS